MNVTPLGPFIAFMSSVTWAIGSTNYAKMSREFTPAQVNLSRAVFGFPLFFLAVFVSGGGFSGGLELFRTLQLEHIGWLGLSMVASYLVGDVLFYMSTVSLGVPGSLAIASGYPVLTALFGYLFLGVSISLQQWAGLLIAVTGIVIVILTDPKKTDPKSADPNELRTEPDATLFSTTEYQAPQPLDPAATRSTAGVPPAAHLQRKMTGVFLAVCTAVCWATNSYSIAQGGQNLDTAVGSTVRMIFGIVLISFFSVVVGRTRPSLIDRSSWRRYAWVFIAEAFFGSYFFMYGLSHSSLVLGSVLTSLAPVLAVPVAILMRLERFSVVRTAAVVLVVFGLALL